MTQIDGRWQIEAQTPMGKQVSTLEIATDGGEASGALVGPDGKTTTIQDGKVEGSSVSFKVHLPAPMKMTLKIDLDFDGDNLTGKIKAGIMPASKATGKRIAAEA